jgi:hypothetical protein
MTSDEITNRIYKLVETLDELMPKWAKAKADHNYCDEMKQVTLNMEKAKSPGKTSAAREEDAYRSEAFTKYLWKVFEIDCEYYSLEGRKGLMEKELDAMRSLLSFEKHQINRTV